MIIAPDLAFLRGHWSRWLALGFGAGLAPAMPGTVGTLVGFPLFALLQLMPVPGQWLALALLFLLGIPVCGRVARELGNTDPGPVVWDEVVAFALVLQITPHTLAGYAVAFALFRLFDIWKPFPIGWVDRTFSGGLGIMLDDLLAAGYAMLVMWHLRGVLHA